MDHAHAISNLPKTKVAILPCRAHEPGFGEERVNVPNERRSRLAPVTTDGQLREAYRFDRELHAMPARLTGGISPVALSSERNAHLMQRFWIASACRGMICRQIPKTAARHHPKGRVACHRPIQPGGRPRHPLDVRSALTPLHGA
jgi:hypothetical protein